MVAPNAQASSRSVWMRLPRTLLAAFTFLAATHCVEIDDRDLDPHPAAGGGDVCDVTSGDDICRRCLKSACCGELQACADSYDCQYFVVCYDSCSDQSCVDLCVAAFPDGADIYLAALDCGSTYCLAECPNDAG